MAEKRVQFNKIVKSQLPAYVRDEFPLIGEFLTEYYRGQEYQGVPIVTELSFPPSLYLTVLC